MMRSPLEEGLSIDRSAGGPKGILKAHVVVGNPYARKEGMRIWDGKKSIVSG
jgi:hypothetical protein